MRIAAVAFVGLAAGAVLTAVPAQADVTVQPVPVHFYPLEPPPVPVVDPDPVVAVQDLQGQIADLHDNWDTLTPDQRQQRIKVLQQQATLVDAETRNLQPFQQLQVEGMLLSAAFQLADLLHKL